MTPHEYQQFALSTYCAPGEISMIEYVEDLLLEEVGEVFSLLAKSKRDGHKVDRSQNVKELGDVLWCVAVHCEAHGTGIGRLGKAVDEWHQSPYYSAHKRAVDVACDLLRSPDIVNLLSLVGYCSLRTGYALTVEEIALANVAKLTSRKERGVLKGSGDNR